LLRIGGTAEAAVATWVLLGLVDEAGIFLIAFGGEADVVELNFIGAGLCDELGESDVVILNFGVRRVGPDQLAVFAPRLSGFLRLHRQFRMFNYHALVAEDGDAGDGVHVFRSAGSARTSAGRDIDLMLAEQGVLEGNVDAAVGIFDIEDDGIAANFSPMADDAESVGRSRP